MFFLGSLLSIYIFPLSGEISFFLTVHFLSMSAFGSGLVSKISQRSMESFKLSGFLSCGIEINFHIIVIFQLILWS